MNNSTLTTEIKIRYTLTIMSMLDYIYPTKLIKKAAKDSAGTDMNYWVCLGAMSKKIPMVYLIIKDFVIILSWYTFVFMADVPKCFAFFVGVIFFIILLMDYFLIKAKIEFKKTIKR